MTDQPQTTTAIQKISNYLSAPEIRDNFSSMMGDREAGAYIKSVLLAVMNNEALLQCTPVSIFKSALRAATLRLSVDPALGQAYLVPYSGVATLIPGYKGLLAMATRTGHYRRIDVYPLRGGKRVEEDIITGQISIVGDVESASDPITGYFAIFEFTQKFGGITHYVYMTVDQIDEHAKKYAPGNYNNPKGTWKKHPEAMRRKTPLRLLLTQWGYLDSNDAAVLREIEDEIDNPDIIEGEVSVTSTPEAPRGEQQIMGELGFLN